MFFQNIERQIKVILEMLQTYLKNITNWWGGDCTKCLLSIFYLTVFAIIRLP